MHINGNDKVERFREARELFTLAQRMGISKLREQVSSWYPAWHDEIKEMSKPSIIERLKTQLTKDAQ